MSGPSVGAKDHSGISNEELAEIMDIPCCTSMSHSGLSDEIAKRLRKYAELLSQVEMRMTEQPIGERTRVMVMCGNGLMG